MCNCNQIQMARVRDGFLKMYLLDERRVLRLKHDELSVQSADSTVKTQVLNFIDAIGIIYVKPYLFIVDRESLYKILMSEFKIDVVHSFKHNLNGVRLDFSSSVIGIFDIILYNFHRTKIVSNCLSEGNDWRVKTILS